MTNSRSPRNYLVVLHTDSQGHVYLGELDPGMRSGVRHIENAVRFTLVGAKRVAASYGTSTLAAHGRSASAKVIKDDGSEI
jgi:hypothetical protein